MVQRIVEELKCRGYNVWFGKSRATLIDHLIVLLCSYCGWFQQTSR
jgi:hypothetical protein